ncbi:MAG: hypothetical protein ABIT16_09855 [Croceibacterium sp.]
MPVPDFLLFASDALLLGLTGAALLLVSIVALLGERRRTRRKQPDAVGCMPWTMLSFLAFFVGVVLIAVAVKGMATP